MFRLPSAKLFHLVPVLLFALAVMFGVGARPAAAGPCKPSDGITPCSTNQSCCGTNGHNGVCIKAPGAKKGLCCTKTNITDTTCDGVDDDCNGHVDDGYVSMSTSCGTGICAATGSTSCPNGQVEDSCTPGTPDCADSVCGDDGCGGSCGTCTPPAVCTDTPPRLCEIPTCAVADLRCTCTNTNVTCHAACPPPTSRDCAGAREDCVRVCNEQGDGPGDCPTRPCTDCTTGDECED